MYKEPVVSMIPNEQKQIFQTKLAQKPQRPEIPPTISFEYRQPPKPKGPPPVDGVYMPAFPQNIAYPPQFNYMMGNPYAGQQSYYVPPMIKNVTINTSGGPGGFGQDERLFTVYEDALPNTTVLGTMSTLGERKELYQFVRSSIFNNVDGENISLSGKTNIGTLSLLSFIKFSEVNPFNAYKYSPNPYRGLPSGFLIYKSCYPIRYQENSGFTQCAIDSAGVNVRIYKLIEGSYLMNRINPSSFYEFDEWREIAFYEFFRENVIKKKICPHFTTLYGYFISKNCGIDFGKIDLMIDNTKQVTNEPIYNELPDETKSYGDLKLNNSTQILSTTDLVIKLKDTNNTIVEINPKSYQGKALVALTESPTYHLAGWASKTYQKKGGNINEMINRGTHSEKEWGNILFQLMVGLYVMQIQKVFIKNFSLEQNVFIKDLATKGAITNFWRYRIDDIDYYLPNLGYLVLIDSNYKDVDQMNKPVFSFVNTSKNDHKIEGKCLGGSCSLTDKQLLDGTFEMFLNAFDPNYFGKNASNIGIQKPPAEIMSLLNDIHTEALGDTNKSIKPYFTKYMRRFLNNRVGTYLKEGEVANVRRVDNVELQKGQIVVHEDSYGGYKFVICLTNNNGVCEVLTKNDHTDQDIIVANLPVSSILNYSKAEPIVQIFRTNETNLSDENMLESYVVKE